MKYFSFYRYLCFLIIFFSFLFLTEHIHAQSSDTINATVQIGICGNDTIEHGEDCEKTNLNEKTCEKLGYTGGTLLCDISCSFDANACSTTTNNTPPASPTPTDEPAIFSSPIQSILENFFPPSQTQFILPVSVQTFDINNNGKLDLSETFSIISVWKQAWQTTNKTQCDINGDTTCTLQDLSTLLYYINR